MSRRGEKKFDTFKFHLDGIEIDIPVIMVKTKKDDNNIDQITFRAEYEPAGISLANSDINKLKEDVEKELGKWHTIDWSYWVRVWMSSRRTYQPQQQELSFHFEFFKLGKTKDGTDVYMHIPDPDFEDGKPWDGAINPAIHFGGSPSQGRPEEGDDDDSWHDGMKTLIPATPENVNAIRKFQKLMQNLGDQMKERFSPKSIKKTIDLISTANNIPMLEEKEEE